MGRGTGVTKDADPERTNRLREAPLGELFPAHDTRIARQEAEKLEKAAHDPSGHRARLRKRLLDGGEGALADHEIIEYLLTTAIPRRDTKPLARSLLARFGSLAGVFNANSAAIIQHPGMGETSAAAIRIVALAARRLARQQISEQPILSTWQELISYLTIDMAHLNVERVRALYLDTKFRLIRDEHLGDGSLDEATIHPREVIRKALDLGAASMILVHNHPSGSPEPSKADVHMTKRIAEAAHHLGMDLHDHVVIGREGHVSFRQRGLL